MQVYRYKAVAMAAGSGTATRAAMHSHDISILATEKDILLQLPCNWIIEGVYANLYIKAWCSNLYIQTVHIYQNIMLELHACTWDLYTF